MPNPGVTIGSPMKTRRTWMVVFAATLGFYGLVAARPAMSGAPDPVATPVAAEPTAPPPVATPVAAEPPTASPSVAAEPSPAPPAAVTPAQPDPAPSPAQAVPPKAAPAAQAAAAAGRHVTELSKKEMAQRIKALPEEERQWLLNYVGPIILPEEKNLFVQDRKSVV